MKQIYGNHLKLGIAERSGAPLKMTPKMRSSHLYICGATRTGKSKLLESLIRQDIWQWRDSKCGLLLLDPHGGLFDGIIQWLAKNNLKRPIVPIDLRQDDWTICYNILRQRPNADPNVVITNFVDAMAHVWGQSGTQGTPLFARWASNVLWPLYEQQHTLLEAQHLIDHTAKNTRFALTANVNNRAVRQAWAYANALSPRDFDAQISSTINRLHPFLSTQIIRRMFGQTGPSLDLGEAMEQGHIVLVNLSTQGGRVTPEDASLVGSLLLSDLWTAAQHRGKKAEAKGTKPFYVFADEFQNFVTPTIAKNLDQAAGFGLHLTLANQFPRQILHAGAHGAQVYDSVFVNARTKVVFSLELEEDLKRLAQALFMGVLNPDKIKQELYSTKVMRYAEEYRTSTTRGGSMSNSSSTQWGRSKGGGAFRGRTDGESRGGIVEDDGNQDANSWNEYYADSNGTSTTWTESEGESNSSSESSSWSETRSSILIPKLGKELSRREFESIADQVFRAMAVLFDQRQRHCVARLVETRMPVSLYTPTIDPIVPNEKRVAAYVRRLLDQCPFAKSSDKAQMQIDDRERQFDIKGANPVAEPTTARRRLL